MNVKEIIKEYLIKNGYDGLYIPYECACKLDNFVRCGEIGVDCEAGYYNDDAFKTGSDLQIGPKK